MANKRYNEVRTDIGIYLSNFLISIPQTYYLNSQSGKVYMEVYVVDYHGEL